MMLAAPTKDTDSSFILPDQTCQHFTLSEIQSATNNFDETLVIGRGGFGKVYKCPSKIGSVSEVAVKWLHSMSNQGATEFEAEVKVLSQLRHGNLVSLLGYCNEGIEMVLVYEFMPNGTLEDHLRHSSLSWLQRLKICIGAARGLDYLHTGTSTQQGIIHRDVKTSNILLDANFAAKISDFGLAKVSQIDQTQTHVSTAVKGTFGYMDPCYFYTGKLTRKSYVYAFGVVLFEVLSGKKAVDSTLDEELWGLAPWAQHKIKQGKLNQIIDPSMIGQISKKCLKGFASIADQCVHTHPNQRPTMAEVVVKLESILSQARKSANSVVDEETFIYISLFTAKVDASNGSKSDFRRDLTVEHPSRKLVRNLKVPFVDILQATNNFDENLVIGRGTFGKVYKGTLHGIKVAIKQGQHGQDQGWTEFVNEILSKIRFKDLVCLIGYCDENSEMLLVYEFMENGTLQDHLYGNADHPKLTWERRLKICISAARGLNYLHTGARDEIIHHDVKSTNILLNEIYDAKVADFGISRLDNGDVKESFGYLDPEYIKCNTLTQKLDVYSFGVVLLEVLCARPALDTKHHVNVNLADWASKHIKNENVETIIDPFLKGTIHSDSLRKFVQIVERCLKETGDERLSMIDVYWDLEYVLKLQEARTRVLPDMVQGALGSIAPTAVLKKKKKKFCIEILIAP